MWLLTVILSIVIIYLLNLLHKQRSKPILRRKVFTGIETHAIIIINDDINSMEIIVNTLVRVLGISEKEAINLMFRTHEEGIAIAWTGNRNTAEENLMNIQRAGIRCYLTEILVSDV